MPGHVRGAGRAGAEGTATGGAGDGRGEDLAAVTAGGGRGAGARGGDGGRGRAGRVGAWDRGLGHQDAVGLEAGGCQGGQHGAVEDCGDGHGVAGLGGADAVVVCGEGARGTGLSVKRYGVGVGLEMGTNADMIAARANSLA